MVLESLCRRRINYIREFSTRLGRWLVLFFCCSRCDRGDHSFDDLSRLLQSLTLIGGMARHRT